MGQFIKFGLCTKVSFPEKSKQRIERYYQSFDNFISEFERKTHLNTQLFNLAEVDNGYSLTLKDELLEIDTLTEFLKAFFADIYDDEKDFSVYCNPIYEDIKDKKTSAELIQFAEQKPHQNFQLSESWRRMDDIDIGYEYIVLFLNGKAYMECYNEFFSYIEKLLRIRHQYLQVGAIKLFLD